MAILKNPLVAVALAGLASAQSSDVVSVFFPGLDEQALVGSVISSAASKTVMVVGCPTDVAADDCGFPDAITVTVGPATFRAEESFDDVTAVLDCSVDGTKSADCAQTYIGPQYLVESDIGDLTASDVTTDTRIITTSTSTVLTGTDVVYVPITLTDAIAGAATTGASRSASTASVTGTRSSTGTHSASASGSDTSGTASRTASGASSTASASSSASATAGTSGNGAGKTDVRALAVTAMGAGLLGLCAILL